MCEMKNTNDDFARNKNTRATHNLASLRVLDGTVDEEEEGEEEEEA
jgi:hypothetical protein